MPELTSKNIYLLLLISVFLGGLWAYSAGGFFILGLSAIIIYFLKRSSIDKEEAKFLIYLFLIGLISRFIFIIFSDLALGLAGKFRYWRGYYIPSLIDDSGYWNLRGWAIAQFLQGDKLPYPVLTSAFPSLKGSTYADNNILLYVIALFHYLFGFSWIAVKFINCIFGLLSAVGIYHIAKELFGRLTARLAAVFTAFFPSIFLWSTTTLKDTSFTFLSVSIVLGVVKFQKTRQLYYLALVIVSSLLQASIRKEFWIITIISFVIANIISINNKRARKSIAFVLVAMAILFFAGKLNFLERPVRAKVATMFVYHRGHVYTPGISYAFLEPKYYTADYRDSSVLAKMPFLDMAIACSKAIYYFMLTPFPWGMRSIVQLIVLPQMLIWYLFLILGLSGIVSALKRGGVAASFLVIYLFLITFSIALVSGNIGTTFRHRDMVTPFYLIFTSFAMVNIFNLKPNLQDK